MKFDHFPTRLVLCVGVAVSLGLAYATVVASSAQDMPSLPAAPAAPQPATQGSSSAPTDTPANPAAGSSQAAAQSSPPAAPETPPAAAAPATPPAQPEQSAQSAAPAAPASPRLAQAELAQLLAPVALYPDQLLGQILMASTYPVQIVEAARWAADPAHRRLKGQALTGAATDRNWDPSVVALLPFPHVLELMSSRIEWTEKLGTAFVAEQSDVMNEVQQLRQQAVDAGNFKSGPQCRCVVERRNHYITVASANPDVIYPPVYNPVAIYGAWPYPAYPPYLFPLPVGFAFEPGFFIGFGYGVDIAYYQPWWGWWGFNWGGGNIIVNNTNFTVIAGGSGGFAGGVWTSRSTFANAATTTRVSSSATRVAMSRNTAGSLSTHPATRGTISTAAASSGRTAASRTAVLGHSAASRAALTHGSTWSGRAAYRGGVAVRSTTSAHGAWRGGRFGSAGAMRGSIRGGGPVHMAAGGGFGHGGGGFARGGGGFAHGGGAVHMAAGGGGHGGGGGGGGGGGRHH